MVNWVELEVAPAPVISPPKRCSSSPKLETIFEEGYFGNNTDGVQMEMEVDLSTRVVYFLPVIISMATYYFLIAGVGAGGAW